MGYPLARRIARTPRLGRRLANLGLFIHDEHHGNSHDWSWNGESALLATLAHHQSVQEGPIFDVGAFHGGWSRLALHSFPNAEIHSFEPNPDSFVALKAQLVGDRRVRPQPVALMNESGSADFISKAGGATTDSVVRPDAGTPAGHHRLRVECRTGDEYLAAENIAAPSLLKVDAEGADFCVLQGFRGALESKSISIVQFEYNLSAASRGVLLRDFYTFLEPLGYVLGPLRVDGVKFGDFRPHFDDFRSGPNYVAALPAVADYLQEHWERSQSWSIRS